MMMVWCARAFVFCVLTAIQLVEVRDNPVQGVSITNVLIKFPLIVGVITAVAADAKIAAYVQTRKPSDW
jgi:hypothetical protein